MTENGKKSFDKTKELNLKVKQDLKKIGAGYLTKVINLRNDDIHIALAQSVNTTVYDNRAMEAESKTQTAM